MITRIPKESSYDVSLSSQLINGQAWDNVLSGNVNMLIHKHNAGVAGYVNLRIRQTYDHNGDNFSELPRLANNSFGATLFNKPRYNQKLEASFSSLTEYRYGGEMVEEAAHLAKQSEERTHFVMMGGLDCQVNFYDDNSSIILYMAGQKTNREHYAGIFPYDSLEVRDHFTDPPYGFTTNNTIQAAPSETTVCMIFWEGLTF